MVQPAIVIAYSKDFQEETVRGHLHMPLGLDLRSLTIQFEALAPGQVRMAISWWDGVLRNAPNHTSLSNRNGCHDCHVFPGPVSVSTDKQMTQGQENMLKFVPAGAEDTRAVERESILSRSQ